MNKTNDYLGKERIYKLLIKFAIPCILSLIFSSFYNIVDQIFVGNSEFGYLGNAATGIVFPILIIGLSFALCIGDGCAAYLSLSQGKNDKENPKKCIGTGISITIAISIILLILLLIFKEQVLRLFGATDSSLDLAIEYYVILISFLPIYMLLNMMNAVIRADGSPIYALICMASGAIINIGLNPLFLYIFKLGIAGVAWSTVISQSISFILSIIYFFKTKTFKLSFKSLIPNFKVFKNALVLGVSTFITQICIVFVSLVSNIVLKKYGHQSIYGSDIAISAISVETKIFTIIINIAMGISLGGQPIIGYNYGAKNIKRVKKTYKIMLISILILGLVSTFMIEVFPHALIGIFGSTDDALYLEFTTKLFRIFLSSIVGTCFVKLTAVFFQAVGQSLKALIVSLIRDLICFIPLIALLPIWLGLDGILYGPMISDVIGVTISVVLTVLFFKNYLNNKNNNVEPVNE